MFEYGFTMKLYALAVVLALAATSLSVAIPKPDDDKKSRIVDKDLSDQDHFNGNEHNPDYDHEAFLGKSEAETFDDLSPEQSKARLGLIFHKIDKDDDAFVSPEELRDWIKHVQNKYLVDDTKRQWKEHTLDTNTLTWESYRSKAYGTAADNADDDDDAYNYADMMRRDKRRWEAADTDGNGVLEIAEFSAFLHPEESEHMRDIVAEETISDMDKDNDGFINLKEYIDDMWPTGEDEPDSEVGKVEPDWVKTEREQFDTLRDKNKDGLLDKAEVTDWIIPSDYDHSDAEAKHLILESDSDLDGKLSKEEVLEKYDLFVGSQATDFGEALVKHDEF